MLNNELDLLKLRLTEGYNLVYKFIIIESKQTHSGFDKPLYSETIKDFLDNYKSKIIHCIIDSFPKNIINYPKGLVEYISIYRKESFKTKEAFGWLREGFQRSIIGDYAKRCNGNDIFIVSDLDEIPNYTKIINDINNNNNNILNEQINYTLPTFIYNIHYKYENYEPAAALTCPARLLNPHNINTFRFIKQKKYLDGYFFHFNRFFKPKELLIKNCSIAESSENNIINIDNIDNLQLKKLVMTNILSGSYNGIQLKYDNYIMPKHINTLPKFYLLDKNDMDNYLKKLNDETENFEEVYDEIINL
jgi:hypothetical protein